MEDEIISNEIEEEQIEQHGDESSSSSFHCIFRTPFPELGFQKPCLVSIGLYHRDKVLPLEKYKYFFLKKILSRTGKDLSFYVQAMKALHWRTRRCYSGDLSTSDTEFIEMMLVDASFIIEVLRHFGTSNDGSKDWVDSLIEPWQTPILALDLLMLENQIPFFVLEELFNISESQEGKATLCVTTMALDFFDLAFPGSMDLSCKPNHFEPNHLLDLFLQFICPSNRSTMQSRPSSSDGVKLEQQCDPPVHLIRSVTELGASDIQFWPRRAKRFTDINFKAGVFEIPPVTINNHFIAILINCVAFEHCCMRSSKYLTTYVSFMSSLITHPNDAQLLRSNGIISPFSNDDKTLPDSLHLISSCISDLHIQDSYLSETLRATESYYIRIGRTWQWRRFLTRHYGISLFGIANFLFAFIRLRPVFCLLIVESKRIIATVPVTSPGLFLMYLYFVIEVVSFSKTRLPCVLNIIKYLQNGISFVLNIIKYLQNGIRFIIILFWLFRRKDKEAKLFQNMSHGQRKAVKAAAEGKALRVSKPKRHDTLEATWKTITDGRPMPLTRHLKKSDTWEQRAQKEPNTPPPPPPPPHPLPNAMKKSDTFDESTREPSLTRSSGSENFKRDPSLSQDELNHRVEAFIKKFKEEMRQESLNQYLQMLRRGAQ